ncbi:MAG: RNA polymerase sigma factor [Lachnospirales bacterium]
MSTFDNMTDMEVIELCLKDNKYFEIIVNRYKNLVFSVVQKMVSDTETSKDLSQEIFIKIYKNLYKYSTEYKFATWIIKISTNHVIDYRRKQHIATVEFDSNMHDNIKVLSAEEECIKKERTLELERLISSLPDEFRIPIVLYHREGLSYQEISNILEIPLSKVKNRIFKGRKLLKELVESASVRGDLYEL